MYIVYAFPSLPYIVQVSLGLYAFPCLPYLAYITLDLNPASSLQPGQLRCNVRSTWYGMR